MHFSDFATNYLWVLKYLYVYFCYFLKFHMRALFLDLEQLGLILGLLLTSYHHGQEISVLYVLVL